MSKTKLLKKITIKNKSNFMIKIKPQKFDINSNWVNKNLFSKITSFYMNIMCSLFPYVYIFYAGNIVPYCSFQIVRIHLISGLFCNIVFLFLSFKFILDWLFVFWKVLPFIFSHLYIFLWILWLFARCIILCTYCGVLRKIIRP